MLCCAINTLHIGLSRQALAETKRLLSEKDTALREKEARLGVLEGRQRQVVELCEQQVADARCA